MYLILRYQIPYQIESYNFKGVGRLWSPQFDVSIILLAYSCKLGMQNDKTYNAKYGGFPHTRLFAVAGCTLPHDPIDVPSILSIAAICSIVYAVSPIRNT
jgi:hypothetical protein